MSGNLVPRPGLRRARTTLGGTKTGETRRAAIRGERALARAHTTGRDRIAAALPPRDYGITRAPQPWTQPRGRG